MWSRVQISLLRLELEVDDAADANTFDFANTFRDIGRADRDERHDPNLLSEDVGRGLGHGLNLVHLSLRACDLRGTDGARFADANGQDRHYFGGGCVRVFVATEPVDRFVHVRAELLDRCANANDFDGLPDLRGAHANHCDTESECHIASSGELRKSCFHSLT